MKLRAGELRQGDLVDGAEVAWVLPIPGRRAVVVSLHERRPDGRCDDAGRIRTYDVEDELEIDDAPARKSLLD